MNTNDENKFKELIDDLKNLPKVEAPVNFESKLWNKIEAGEEKPKEKFWQKLFLPSRLAPATVAIATALVVFFMVNTNSEEMEDPFTIEPRLRQDIIEVNDSELEIMDKLKETQKTERVEKKKLSDELSVRSKNEIQPEVSEKDEAIRRDETPKGSEKSGLISDERALSESIMTEGEMGLTAPSPMQTETQEEIYAAPITKEELNFRQINLSVEEKQQVEQLKQKMQLSEEKARNK